MTTTKTIYYCGPGIRSSVIFDDFCHDVFISVSNGLHLICSESFPVNDVALLPLINTSRPYSFRKQQYHIVLCSNSFTLYFLGDDNNWVRVIPYTKYGAPARGATISIFTPHGGKQTKVCHLFFSTLYFKCKWV